MAEDNATWGGLTAPCIERSRTWAFTTTGVVEGIMVREIRDVVVCIGPREVDSRGRPHHHGIIMSKRLDGKEAQPKRKAWLSKVLSQLEISINYLAPIAKFNNTVKYTYKNDPEAIPAVLQEKMQKKVNNPQSVDYHLKIAQEVASQFEDKPSMNAFYAKVFEREINFPAMTLKRCYEMLDFGNTKRLQKAFIKRKKRCEAPALTVEEGMNWVKQIMKGVTSIKWKGRELTTKQGFLILIQLALEIRDEQTDGIQIAQHAMFKGLAGRGKTLLCQILFPSNYAAILTNDSTGVGQIVLRMGQKAVKVDHAEAQFFNNQQLVSCVKTMYHNAWSAKTHGARQDNAATACIITTNVEEPLQLMAIDGTVSAFERRFVEFSFYSHPAFQQDSFRRIPTNVTDDIVAALAQRIVDRISQKVPREVILRYHVKNLEIILRDGSKHIRTLKQVRNLSMRKSQRKSEDKENQPPTKQGKELQEKRKRAVVSKTVNGIERVSEMMVTASLSSSMSLGSSLKITMWSWTVFVVDMPHVFSQLRTLTIL